MLCSCIKTYLSLLSYTQSTINSAFSLSPFKWERQNNSNNKYLALNGSLEEARAFFPYSVNFSFINKSYSSSFFVSEIRPIISISVFIKLAILVFSILSMELAFLIVDLVFNLEE